MKNTKKSFKIGMALLFAVASVNLAGCGKRINPTAAALLTQPSAAPQQIYDPAPSYNDYYPNNTLEAVAPAVPNTQSGSFKVDQSTFSSWQAKGIAAAGGTIYLTVADTKGIMQYGTIVKMNSTDGKGWKNIGTGTLGLTHPIGKTVQGIAISGSTLIAVDSSSKVYTLDISNNKVKTNKAVGGIDVAAGGGSVFIANGTVAKTDTSASSSTPINGLSASGGVGADNQGNGYAVNGNTIKKVDMSGMVQDVITSDLTAPVDVASDSRNGDIYVLEQSMIKRFNLNGQLLCSFSSGASKPVAITVDESGCVYVADAGSSNKDSKVIKFAASTNAVMNNHSFPA